MQGLPAAIGWTVAIIVIALGAAGIVAGMDGPPSGALRPELTYRGDALVTPELDKAQADLASVGVDVEALGTQARGALAALVGSELDTVDAAIAKGDELVASIHSRTTRLSDAFATLPVIGTPAAGYELSAAVQERALRLRDALRSTAGLDAAWGRLTTGSVAASKLSGLLAAHVDAVLKAADLGRKASYKKAAAALDAADEALKQSRALRDTLSRTVDVSVLDDWLDRNERYDVALRKLYVALRDVGGRVTKDVRDAIKGEKKAKDRLPPDSRGLILIMSDIGRGGMNSAVIAIEETRGRLADALEPPASTDPGASPTVAP